MKRRDFILLTAAGLLSTSGPASKYCALPPVDDGRALVIYHHGRGENRNALKNDPLKTSLLQFLRGRRFTIAACDAHGDNWGYQASIDDYVNLYNYCLNTLHVSPNLPVLFLAQSMGGMTGLLNLVDGRIPNVKGWYGIYPATNLTTAYANASFKVDIDLVYGIDGSHSYATQTAGHDPQLLDAADFPNIRYRASASAGDTLVPKATNWDLMASKLSGKLEASTLTVSGNHGDISHFNNQDVLDFYGRCLS